MVDTLFLDAKLRYLFDYSKFSAILYS